MPELPLPPTPEPLGTVLTLLLGLALLVAGRRLFWLALGVAGFLAGWQLSAALEGRLPAVEGVDPAVLSFALAIGLGLLGMLLAIFLQKIAIGVAGFLAGGVGALWLAVILGLPVGGWEWAVFLVSGVIGAVLAGILFEMALMVLSSLLGAALLLDLVTLDARVEGILALTLTVVGCLIQGRGRGRSRRLRRRD